MKDNEKDNFKEKVAEHIKKEVEVKSAAVETVPLAVSIQFEKNSNKDILAWLQNRDHNASIYDRNYSAVNVVDIIQEYVKEFHA